MTRNMSRIRHGRRSNTRFRRSATVTCAVVVVPSSVEQKVAPESAVNEPNVEEPPDKEDVSEDEPNDEEEEEETAEPMTRSRPTTRPARRTIFLEV